MSTTTGTSKSGALARICVYFQAAGVLLVPVVLAATPAFVSSEYFESLVFDRAVLCIAGAPLALLLAIRCALVAAGLIRFRGEASAWLSWYRSAPAAAARRRRRMKLVAVIGAVVIALCLAEGAIRLLRLHDPYHVPQGVVFADYDVRLNDIGLREAWDVPPPPDGRTRVAVLGDSIVFGLGVPPAQTFAKLLESELSDRSGGVLTFNVGAPGTAPYTQCEKLEELLPLLQPDLVLHVLYPNDLGVELRSLVQRIHDIRAEAFWTGRWSYLLHLVELKIREAAVWRNTLAFYRGGLTAAERERAWRKFESDLVECRDRFHGAGADYLLVLFPWLIELHDYPLRDVHERIGLVVGRLNVPYFDLLPVFAGRDAALYRNSDVDEHPNALGHELAAGAIANFLRNGAPGS